MIIREFSKFLINLNFEDIPKESNYTQFILDEETICSFNFQNPIMMIQQFNQFRNQFQGDPQKEVQKLIAEGKINQAQLNELQKMATDFQRAFNIR